VKLAENAPPTRISPSTFAIHRAKRGGSVNADHKSSGVVS
jgi:hypothetical protein